MDKVLEHISDVLTDIMNLYNEIQIRSLSESKYCIDNISEMLKPHNEILISTVDSLLDTESIFTSKMQLHLLELDKMLVWHQLYLEDKKHHQLDGHNFNVFKLFSEYFNFNLRETMHSKLIKYLLDKDESHGQGTKFLEILLMKLDILNPSLGQWEVTAEQGHIDILLKREIPHSIIVIENKSNWAQDQPNQLYRYWHDQVYSNVKEVDTSFYQKYKDRYQIIYLAPNFNKTISEQSLQKPKEWTSDFLPSKIPLSPTVFTFDIFIQEWLNNCENELQENNRVRQYIAQYKELCKKL